MNKELNKFTLRSVLISLCLIALGVIIILNANEILFWVIKAIGVFLIIDSIIRLIMFLRLDSEERKLNFDLIRAIIEVAMGIVAIVNSSSVITLLYVFIGVIIIAEGILHLQFVLIRRNQLKGWILNFFIALINILCGVFVVAHPILTSGVINVIIGIEIIAASVIGICGYLYLYYALKRAYIIYEDEQNNG